MTNPRDILGGANPSGAFPDRPDPRHFILGTDELGGKLAPFDWDKGYDIEAEISAALGMPFTFHVKNQGSSGSCGGQAAAYHDQALKALFGKTPAERSAKFVYSQIYYPGGGTTQQDVGEVLTKQGVAPEALCPSYSPTGQPLAEEQYERPQDITGAARASASAAMALSYAYTPDASIDTVAAALAAGAGVRVILRGSNNGTWLSAEPKPPSYAPAGLSNDPWAHFLYLGKAFLENGAKKVWALNSWGVGAGIGGWQKLDEAYFASGAVLGAQTVVYNPNPVTAFRHTFTSAIKLGDRGAEVVALQSALQALLCFPSGVPISGYYGPITEGAVLRFQLRYRVAAVAELQELGGSLVGPATRAALNKQLNP